MYSRGRMKKKKVEKYTNIQDINIQMNFTKYRRQKWKENACAIFKYKN